MSGIDHKIIDGAMDIFRNYAAKNGVGRPAKVIQDMDNESPFPENFGLACFWTSEIKTAIRFGPQYRAEMQVVEQRLKDWENP